MKITNIVYSTYFGRKIIMAFDQNGKSFLAYQSSGTAMKEGRYWENKVFPIFGIFGITEDSESLATDYYGGTKGLRRGWIMKYFTKDNPNAKYLNSDLIKSLCRDLEERQNEFIEWPFNKLVELINHEFNRNEKFLLNYMRGKKIGN